jgi:glyoxylase-like metal-dependent hydrolase (beta-lactamase superfamily II)
MMATIEPRWNDKGLHHDLPQFISDFEKQIAAAKANHAAPERVDRAEQRLATDKQFLEQKLSLQQTLPDVTFSDQAVLHMGEREIRVLHARAITPGDTYLFLPKEKILITGDILLDPYPYAIGGTYPAQWLATLKQFAALQPSAVIPGHGAAQSGSKLIENTIAVFEEVMRQTRDANARGMTLDQTVAKVGGNSKAFAALAGITGDDEINAFKNYFLDVFVTRAYRELRAPLGDLPDGLQ